MTVATSPWLTALQFKPVSSLVNVPPSVVPAHTVEPASRVAARARTGYDRDGALHVTPPSMLRRSPGSLPR